jgi:hypothetical protein
MKTALLDLISYVQFAHPSRLLAELDAWFDSLDESDNVLAFLLYEFLPHKEEVTVCLHYLRDKKVTVLLDDQYRQLEYLWVGLDIVYLHYWPLYTKTLSNIHRLPWNNSSKKALMLTGKMHFLNRVGALASAYKSNAIGNIIFSFMYHGKDFSPRCKEIISHWGINPDELFAYCHANKQSIDLEHIATIPTTRDGSKDFEFYVDLVDPQAYAQTKISIVSETFSKSIGTVTEKIWKTIMCRHPYVLMALPGTTQYLSSIGIQNINHLVPNHIENDVQSAADIDAIIGNAMWFIESNAYDAEVEQIIENNYQLYYKLAAIAFADVQSLSIRLNIPSLLHDLMNRKTEETIRLRKRLALHDMELTIIEKRKQWEDFYYSVKGESWPTIPPDILNLPEFVSVELRQMNVNLQYYVPVIHPMSATFL